MRERKFTKFECRIKRRGAWRSERERQCRSVLRTWKFGEANAPERRRKAFSRKEAAGEPVTAR